MALGRNVGALIDARGLSQAEVARAIGMDEQQGLHNLIKRNSKKSEFAPRLAEYFGVRLERLLAEDFDVAEAVTKLMLTY